MGIKSEAFTAPLAFAQLAQRAASFQKALQLPAGMAALIKECETRTAKLKAALDKSALPKFIKQVRNTFAKVKTLFKKLFVKYLPIVLPLTEIPRAQIPPSTGKALQLPNSYRSHSPPFCSVIV